jgi:hypothetical protein
MVQNGKFSAGAALLVKILKKVDLPEQERKMLIALSILNFCNR